MPRRNTIRFAWLGHGQLDEGERLLDEENYAANVRQRVGDAWNLDRRAASGGHARRAELNSNLRQRCDPMDELNLDPTGPSELSLGRSRHREVDARTSFSSGRRHSGLARGPFVLVPFTSAAVGVGGLDLDAHAAVCFYTHHESLRRREAGEQHHREAEPGGES